MNIRNASDDKVISMDILFYLIVMSFGSILYEHTEENRKELRQIESLNKKLINGKAALSFNEHCYTNNLLPSYTNIHLNSEAVRQKRFTLQFRRNLVLNQIEEKKSVVKKLEAQVATRTSRYIAYT